MRLVASCVLVLLSAVISANAASPADLSEQTRIINSFDRDWRFLKTEASDAEKSDFDDSAWRTLDVPHDWSIEGAFDEKNPTGGAGGFLPGGIGWYRKHFSLPTEYAKKRVFIEFDGVMANSDVWINGQHLGKRPFGYVPFRYELTGKLNFGDKTNALAVRADNSKQPASRWYAGAGIYRHVHLIVTDPVHIEQWSTFIATPKIEADRATVQVQTTVVNQSDSPCEVELQSVIVSPDGKTVQTTDSDAKTIPAGKSADFTQDVIIKNPQLWNIDNPNLYHAVLKIRSGKVSLDDEVTTFGIREFKFEPETGFRLNGKNFKIKGVCLHHDCGALGTAVPLKAWERRLSTLKKLGVNAIRTAHNPVAPEFLDLCDRLGFLVMDEFFDCWTVRKTPYDYHLFFKEWSKIDARDIIRHDRNHPSVILYSVGNEIHDTPKADLAKEVLKSLVDVCHENDSTRPVTQALFRPNVSHDYDNGLADMLDVIGTNYRDIELLAAQKAKPTRKIIGTEQSHDRNIWLAMRDNPSHAGQFLWTGIDYLGESRSWPIVAAGSGLLDLTGMIKPMGYERQSWWSDKPMVYAARRLDAQRSTPSDPGFEPLNRRQSLFADWTPADTTPHDENIEVYSNCEEVELFLNDKSLGSKPLNRDASARVWKVAYEPGVLKAVGKNSSQTVATHELQTAGKAAKIVLSADQSVITTDWDDVAYVTAAVTDENGVQVPSSDDAITFKLEGPGVIVGVENGDRSSHEPFQASERKAYQGRCVAILKSNGASGRVILTATSSGLKEASLTIDTETGQTTNNTQTSSANAPTSANSSEQRLPTLFIIGDSTVKNGSGKGDGGLWGWGYPIAELFDLSKIRVENRAIGGRSSRTFITEGRWDKILAELKLGDFVLMQFGHNDGGSLTSNRARGTLKGNGEESQEIVVEATGKNEVVHTYGWYMRKYVADTKAKGATPIVLSLIPRNIWKDGKVTRGSNDYGKWAAEAAKDEGGFFIDLNGIVANHYDEIGEEKVASEFFSTKDHTHTTSAGARLNADCVVEGLKQIKDCSLNKFLKTSTEQKAEDTKETP